MLVLHEVGMDTASFALAFGRFAPAQLLTHGHASTSGLPTADAFVSYASLEAPGAEAHYSEALVAVAGFSPYPTPDYILRELPAEGSPPSAASCEALWGRLGLPPAGSTPAGRRVYYVPQTLFKLGPPFDEALVGILRADPSAVLLLKRLGVACAGLTSRGLSCDSRLDGDVLFERVLRRLGPAALGRAFFAPSISDGDFTRAWLCADAVLDPFPFGGYTTVLEALAAGVPTITWPHAAMASRTAVAMYRLLAEEAGEDPWTDCCVAEGAASYVRKAVLWARAGADGRQSLIAATRRLAPQLFNRLGAGRAWARTLAEASCARWPAAGDPPIILGRGTRLLRLPRSVRALAFPPGGRVLVRTVAGWHASRHCPLTVSASSRWLSAGLPFHQLWWHGSARLALPRQPAASCAVSAAAAGRSGQLLTLRWGCGCPGTPELAEWAFRGRRGRLVRRTPLGLAAKGCRGSAGSPQLVGWHAADSGATLELAPGRLARVQAGTGSLAALPGRRLAGLAAGACCARLPGPGGAPLWLGLALDQSAGAGEGGLAFYAYGGARGPEWLAAGASPAVCLLAPPRRAAGPVGPGCMRDVVSVEGLATVGGSLAVVLRTAAGRLLGRVLDVAKVMQLLHLETAAEL